MSIGFGTVSDSGHPLGNFDEHTPCGQGLRGPLHDCVDVSLGAGFGLEEMSLRATGNLLTMGREETGLRSPH